MLGKRCPPPIGSHGENGSRHLQGNSAAHWSRTVSAFPLRCSSPVQFLERPIAGHRTWQTRRGRNTRARKAKQNIPSTCTPRRICAVHTSSHRKTRHRLKPNGNLSRRRLRKLQRSKSTLRRCPRVLLSATSLGACAEKNNCDSSSRNKPPNSISLFPIHHSLRPSPRCVRL